MNRVQINAKNQSSMKTVEVDSVTYYIGQNAYDHHPMLDNAKPSDLWFHLEGPSCHVIASVPDGISREKVRHIIRKGTQLIRKVSSQFNSKVIYRRVRNVTKGNSPGEVILDMI